MDAFNLAQTPILPYMTKTCFTKNHSSSIDVILTNRPRSFQKTAVFETGLSDYHGFGAITMKQTIPRLKPKQIKYRSYKILKQRIS